MRISRTLTGKTVSVVALIVFTTLVCVSKGTERGADYLFRSIRGSFNTNIIVFLKQQDSNSDSFVTFKVQRSKSGKTRNTVTAPLREQGNESVDDGEKLYSYLPSEKVLLISPSIAKGDDSNFRIPLIQKNYDISTEAGMKIAGRSTVKVTTTSKFEGVGNLIYYFDEVSGYPLRKEAFTGSTNKLIFEVSDISFPAQFDSDVFKLRPRGGSKLITFASPPTVNSASKVQSVLGFQPALFPKLPYGFQIQTRSMTKQDEWKAVSIKITDGLQKATVYQWNASSDEQIMSGEKRTISKVGKVRIMIVSDLNAEVRSKLLKAFTRELTSDENIQR